MLCLITEQEVLKAQKIWADKIIHIGKVFAENGDYVLEAEKLIDELYGYDLGLVLFKPTFAADKQFRITKEGALSYFVGNNNKFPEDKGFAIKQWEKIRFENTGIIIECNVALTMGNYYFLKKNSKEEIKVEFTFAYKKDNKNKLRIIMHGHIYHNSPNV